MRIECERQIAFQRRFGVVVKGTQLLELASLAAVLLHLNAVCSHDRFERSVLAHVFEVHAWSHWVHYVYLKTRKERQRPF